MPKDTASSEPLEKFIQSEDLDPNDEYICKIMDLESRIRILKQQVIIAMEQAKNLPCYQKVCRCWKARCLP
jgi:hypothetical protein